MVRLHWAYLGRVPYRTALRLQDQHARQVSAGADPRLLLLEHPPTVTLGRQADVSNLKLTEAGYERRGIQVVRTLRGGDVTYHGPGQLVGYPVADLRAARCPVPAWVQGHARAIARVLARFGIQARWSDTHPGVWVERRKIAALGFHVSRGVSTHGFAINVHPDLSHFDTIVPCGLRNLGVTSMAELMRDAPSMPELASRVAAEVASTFGWVPGEESPRLGALEERTHAQDNSSLA
jgi:lipoate-protein ligase B